jgi:hypothetical protein
MGQEEIIVSAKAELHELVDRLGDERAVEALAYLRHLAGEDQEDEEATARLAARMEPLAVPGRAFFSQPRVDLETVAAQHGVPPVSDLDDLLGDFWPEEESVDEFVAAVRRWRREGGYA